MNENTSQKFLLVGSDPEMQLRKRTGELVSAIDLIPGTKENPFKTKNGSVQWDNIFAEVNSKPARTSSEFILNHKLILSDLEEIIKPLDLKLDFMASVLAGPELLSDPRACQAGCDPDFNAWELNVNEPADYSITNIRASGGHLHCSFDQAETEGEPARIKFVRALDLILGVPSCIHDSDVNRRKYYGKAGSFRPKNTNDGDAYNGIEYRTLSNFWLRSEGLMEFVFQGVKSVYENLDELSNIAETYKDWIVHTINSGDRDEAIRICNKLGVKYACNI